MNSPQKTSARDSWTQRLRHPIIAAIAVVLGLAVASVALNLKFLNPLKSALADFSTTDLFYQQQLQAGVRDSSTQITIVDMGALYDRGEIAVLLDEIEQLNPRVVAVDAVFQNWREDSLADMALAAVCFAYDNILLNCYCFDLNPTSDNYETLVKPYFFEGLDDPSPFVNDSTATKGRMCCSLMPREMYGNGTKRTVTMSWQTLGQSIPSFAWLAASRYLGEEAMPISSKPININYRPKDFNTLLPEEVSQHPELIRDHIVLFGAMHENEDMHQSPIGKLAGLEILAYAIDTLISHSEAKDLTGWPLWIISFLLICCRSWTYATHKRLLMKVRPEWLRLVLNMSFFKMLNLFIWMGFWLWITMLIFNINHLSINPTAAFGCAALIPYACEFYSLFFERKPQPATTPAENLVEEEQQEKNIH